MLLKEPDHSPFLLPSAFFELLAENESFRTDSYISPVSGRTISCYKTPNLIEIKDEKAQDSFFVKMRVDNQVLTAYAKTKGWQGKSKQKHPDLFATQLLINEFRYLTESSNSPQYFLAQWKSSGDLKDNFCAFKQALRKTGVDWNLFPLESKTVVYSEHEFFQAFEQAVSGTWTWGLMQKLSTNPRLESVVINRVSWSPDPYGFDSESAYDFVYARILL